MGGNLSQAVKLLVICGLSFAGKTTLSEAIVKRFGFAQVDVDETKARLFGPDARDEDLSRGDWERLYAETDRQMETLLSAGKTVIDASRNFTKAERDAARSIAASAGRPTGGTRRGVTSATRTSQTY